MDNITNVTNSTHYSNCRVSGPVIYPGKQAVSFNGFAWSPSMGMIHEITNTPNEDWKQWLATQQ
jgi:hypothetical protein